MMLLATHILRGLCWVPHRAPQPVTLSVSPGQRCARHCGRSREKQPGCWLASKREPIAGLRWARALPGQASPVWLSGHQDSGVFGLEKILLFLSFFLLSVIVFSSLITGV